MCSYCSDKKTLNRLKITAIAVTHPIAQLHHWNRSRLEAGNHQFVSTAAGTHQVLVWRLWSRFIFRSWRFLQLSPVYNSLWNRFWHEIIHLTMTFKLDSQFNYVDLSHLMETFCTFGISTGSQNLDLEKADMELRESSYLNGHTREQNS